MTASGVKKPCGLSPGESKRVYPMKEFSTVFIPIVFGLDLMIGDN
jgi:hypothetical protein